MSHLPLRSTKRARGFTLVELAIVLAIFSVLMAKGIPAIADFVSASMMRTAASELHHAANTARSEAIKRNIRAELRVTATAWSVWNMTVTPNVQLRAGTLDARVTATPVTLDYASNGRTTPAGTTATIGLSSSIVSCGTAIACPSVRITSGGSSAVCNAAKSAGTYGACS